MASTGQGGWGGPSSVDKDGQGVVSLVGKEVVTQAAQPPPPPGKKWGDAGIGVGGWYPLDLGLPVVTLGAEILHLFQTSAVGRHAGVQGAKHRVTSQQAALTGLFAFLSRAQILG